ncbi:MAG: hypothetical protein WD070_09260, partial [Pirellulaceae bacterium]
MKFSLALTLLLLPSVSTAEDVESVVSLLEFVIDVDEATAAQCLATLRQRVQSGEVTGAQREAIRRQLGDKLREVLAAGPKSPLYIDTLTLATSWGDKDAARKSRDVVANAKETEPHRLAAIDALAAARDAEFLTAVSSLLATQTTPESIQSRLLGALGRYDDPAVAELVLECYEHLAANLQPQAIELLTQRATWSRRLLAAIGRQDLSPSVLNVNQVRTLLASSDK